MSEQSLKSQAEEIIEAVDHDLQTIEAQPLAVQDEVNSKANHVMDTIFRVVSDVDLDGAIKRIEALKTEHPESSRAELSKKLVFDKCQKTGTVGAVTSSAGLIPGVGTAVRNWDVFAPTTSCNIAASTACFD